MPPIDWKGLFDVASEIPIVKRAIGATLEELEQNPAFTRFVEKYQAMNANTASRGGVTKAECMICLFHKYGRERGLSTLDAPPQHRCVDHGENYYP